MAARSASGISPHWSPTALAGGLGSLRLQSYHILLGLATPDHRFFAPSEPSESDADGTRTRVVPCLKGRSPLAVRVTAS